ncbi:hypothetical protein [Desertibaculum subflavum]|uniref:hypothetical protein n=1 Tax=Desertibaculum subflavum TaxID=2268458 RepID=UPI000E666A74
MSAVVAMSSAPADVTSEPGIIGFIDVIEPRKVSGWAWNPQAPGARLDVEVILDGQVLAIARAERKRGDLAHANVGDGHYGFVAHLDEDLAPEAMGRLGARVLAPDGEQIPLLNRAQRGTPRLVETGEPLLAELKELRSEARETQRGFQGTVQTALHEMLRVLERMASEHKTGLGRADRKPAAPAGDRTPGPLTTLSPAAARDETEAGDILRRIDSLEAAMLRLDKTLSGIDARLAKIDDVVNRNAVARPLLAAVSFASLVGLVIGALALFR